MNVLIVEDDDTVRAVCAEIITSSGCHVRTAESVPSAQAMLAEATPDVVFLDMRLPGGTGASLLDEIRSLNPGTFVVVMSAYATVGSAVELMRNGAGDFLPKPFALDQVTAVLQKAMARRQWSGPSRALQDQLKAGIGAGRLLGQSPAMSKLFRIVSKVAFTRHPVLLLGERGSGKEVVARAIHANGPSAAHSFVPIDCDALDASRLEQELFGSDSLDSLAPGGRPGLLTSAGEGTIYLAEVNSLTPPLQARLLRVLQDRRTSAPGVGPSSPFSARVLASSSRNLEAMAEDGRFRKDLFYRLNVVNLRVPALRDRPEDIPLLAEHFLDRERRERGTPYVLSDDAAESMLSYTWPGNVQELEGLIEHACAISSGPVIHLGDMSTNVRAYVAATQEPEPEQTLEPDAVSVFLTLEQMEKRAIQDALERLHGDKVLTARCLGIGKTTLYRKLKEYGISHDTP